MRTNMGKLLITYIMVSRIAVDNKCEAHPIEIGGFG